MENKTEGTGSRSDKVWGVNGVFTVSNSLSQTTEKEVKLAA